MLTEKGNNFLTFRILIAYISNLIKIFFSLGNYGEIIIKTPDEYWITGKSSNDREFYVIIQEKNANLKDIAGMYHEIKFS